MSVCVRKTAVLRHKDGHYGVISFLKTDQYNIVGSLDSRKPYDRLVNNYNSPEKAISEFVRFIDESEKNNWTVGYYGEPNFG